MNSVSVDFLATNAGEVAEGGSIQPIGPRQAPNEVAVDLLTIAYEIVTCLGRRQVRRYLEADVVLARMPGQVR